MWVCPTNVGEVPLLKKYYKIGVMAKKSLTCLMSAQEVWGVGHVPCTCKANLGSVNAT